MVRTVNSCKAAYNYADYIKNLLPQLEVKVVVCSKSLYNQVLARCIRDNTSDRCMLIVRK